MPDMPDFNIEEQVSSGIFAGIQIGYACPKCRVFSKEPPNRAMPMCSDLKAHKTPLTIKHVLYIEKRDKKHLFIDMEIFGKEQRNVLHAIIENVNDAWGWILNHDHAVPLADEAYVDMVKEQLSERLGQVEDRLAAVESAVDGE